MTGVVGVIVVACALISVNSVSSMSGNIITDRNLQVTIKRTVVNPRLGDEMTFFTFFYSLYL